MTHLATVAMREDAGRAVPPGVQPIPELAVLVRRALTQAGG